MKPTRKRTPGGEVLFDPSLVRDIGPRFFTAEFWSQQGLVHGSATGRGAAQFVRYEGRDWVLKHYRRGGLVGKLVADRYVWLGSDRTRSFREWHMLDHLRRAGLPVPRPVAAHYERVGLTYRADLITERLADTSPLSVVLANGNLTPGTWEAIGATIAAFHNAGAWHADLNAHNILLDARGEIYLIDFDRGEYRSAGSWRQANLARLRRSFDKITTADPTLAFDNTCWAGLMAGYRMASADSRQAR